MPYNDELAVRMSAIFSENNHIIEKKMFGGVGYLLNGNMVCGILQDHLILRLEPKEAERYLSKPGYEPFMNHANTKPMKGWVSTRSWNEMDRDELESLINLALQFGSTLPIK